MAFFDLTEGPDNRTFAPGQLAGDSVRGLGGNDTINGSGDSEDINGNRGNDIINGGGGNDTLLGGQENDSINGNDDSDSTNGNLGDDTVFGGAGDDIVRGGQNNDSVVGGDGNDFLYGDFGTDFLTGGAGNDVFVLRTGTAVPNPSFADVITDFGNGVDQIGLTGGLSESGITLVSGGGSLPFSASDTLIRIGTGGDFLGVVLNVTPGLLTGRFTSAPG
jgi:Ca2+-binding RTX toxin-like protein